MPLTRRQFELGIDDEIENWMRQIYDLMANHRDLAYSSHEISQVVLGESPQLLKLETLPLALNVLTEIGALDERKVAGMYYYKFRQAFDTNTWRLDLISI